MDRNFTILFALQIVAQATFVAAFVTSTFKRKPYLVLFVCASLVSLFAGLALASQEAVTAYQAVSAKLHSSPDLPYFAMLAPITFEAEAAAASMREQTYLFALADAILIGASYAIRHFFKK